MLALSGTMLVGCTQSEYIGDAPQQNGNEIVFSGASGKMTRATSNTGASDAVKLDGQIKFYGVKKKGTTYAKVFEDYVLWSQGGVTTSNPDGDWEYVGVKGQGYGTTTAAGKTEKDQFIKYWDFATDEYHFVAGSPVKAFTYALDDDGEIATATVTGIAGHLNPNDGKAINTDPIYIAAPVKVANANYKKDVVFSFTRQQSFVRVGVFETIPGYEITDIKFYSYGTNAWTNTSSNYITLASVTPNYFTGATDASATITYKDWDSTPTFEFAYDAYDNGTKFEQQNNWFGGKLENGVPAETSTNAVYGTDGDMVASTGYFTVIPTTSELDAAPLLVKCDYTLKGLDSNDIINVKGATAAIPAAYAKWAPNTSYTYLFKISDNTNGSTGVEGDGKEGLFPITFDAAVVEVEDGTAQGTVTTVSTPSITTYQEGFAAAMKYVAGKAIYVTAQNDETGELYKLNGKVKVFSLGTTAKTEADLILTAPTTGETTFTVGSGQPVGSVTYEAGMYGAFTPGAAGYYAIQYEYAAGAYAYKVVCVE